MEVHLGAAPDWLLRARGRAPVIADAFAHGMYKGDTRKRAELDVQLDAASPASLAEAPDNWLVAFVFRREVEWPDEAVTEAPWLWWNGATHLLDTEKEMKARIPSLDLAARAIAPLIPGVYDAIAVRDRVYVSRDSTFDDAFPVLEFTAGEATFSTRSTIDRVETLLATGELDRVLENAMTAPVVPSDPTRATRFTSALQNDRLLDDGGSYGRYELLREIQPTLMRATPDQPLATMFIDMNSLKEINDSLGHAAGDAAIAEFRSAVHSEHTGMLFRTGGDEFVMFALGLPAETLAIGRRLLKAIGARDVGGRRLSASIGVVLAHDTQEAPRDIIGRADAQMYRAKELSRSTNPRTSTLAIEDGEVVVVDA